MLRSGLSRYASTSLSSDLAHRCNITTTRISSLCFARALSTTPRPPSDKPKPPYSKPRKSYQGDSRNRKGNSDPPNPRKRELKFTADGKPKLRAYDLTQRLVKLCQDGEMNEAIEQLKNMPRDAQDVACWNSIIKLVLQDGRYKQAHQLFTEMKRRSFEPNLRTYNTLLRGYTFIDDWEGRSMNEDQLHSIFSGFQELVDKLRQKNEHIDPLTCVGPFNDYLTCLGKLGKHQEMWDLFHAMPATGIGAANVFTYSTILSAILDRKAPPAVSDPDDPGATSTPLTPEEDEVYRRNASDALLVWRLYLRAIERRPELKLDPLPAFFMLQNMLRSPANPHLQFGLGVVEQYFGLPATGTEAKRGKFDVSGQFIRSLLSSLVAGRSYNLCLHYGNLIMQHPRHSKKLDFGHIESLLEAHAALAKPRAAMEPGSKTHAESTLEMLDWMLGAAYELRRATFLTPRQSTYKHIFRACWHSGDWVSACGAFERMTGLRAEMFSDEPPLDAPPPLKRSPGRALELDGECFSNLFRTALASGVAAQRQALRMLAHWGPDFFSRTQPLDRDTTHTRDDSDIDAPTRAMLRFAALVIRVVENVTDRSKGKKRIGAVFKDLRFAAMNYQRTFEIYPSASSGEQNRYGDKKPRLWTRTEEDDWAGAAKTLRDSADAGTVGYEGSHRDHIAKKD